MYVHIFHLRRHKKIKSFIKFKWETLGVLLAFIFFALLHSMYDLKFPAHNLKNDLLICIHVTYI